MNTVVISTAMLLLVLVSILSRDTTALQVIGGNMTVAEGGTVVLPCNVIDTTETLRQISWQRKTRGRPRNEYFYKILPTDGPKFVNGYDDRFKFVGSIEDRNGSLQLSNVTLMDEGIYTCTFTLFSSGHHKTEVPLNLLVPPVLSLLGYRPLLGDPEVSLVRCMASGSKPPTEVRWEIGGLAGKVRETTDVFQHDNGTTSTVSFLFGVPSREINRQPVQCVVTNAALKTEETLPSTIQVDFAPTEVTICEQGPSLFECVTDANPEATFTWERSNSQLPQSVKVEGATLQFVSVSSDLNGLYKCEATNMHGRQHGYLFVHVMTGACITCWVLFSLLLILIVAVVAWYLYTSRKYQSYNRGRREVPSSPSAADAADPALAHEGTL